MGHRTALYPKGNITGVGSDSNYVTTQLTYLDENGAVAGILTAQETKDLLYPYFRNAERRDRNVYLQNPVPQHFGPFQLKDVDPPPPIPQRFYEYKRPRRSNQPAWNLAKRKKTNSMIVSPYMNWQVNLTYEHGLVNGRQVATTTGTTDCRAVQLFQNEAKHIMIGGYKVPGNGPRIYRNYVGMRYSIGVSPLEVGWSDKLGLDIVQSFLYKINHSLVTDAASAANTGTTDLLTNLAEAPEAIKSALRGCITLMRLYKDAKTRNLRLVNKAARRNMEKNRYLQLTANEKRDAKAHAIHMQKLRTFEQSIKDLHSAAADVWLNLRLNILPTVGAIEDTIKGIDELSLATFFRRYRETTAGEIPFEFNNSEWESSLDHIETLERVMIKRSVDKHQSFRQIFSINPFVTAWNLIPLSFVLDRYMNIGALLSAFYGPSTNVKEAATYSWKVDDTIVFIHRESKASVTMRFSAYKRLVINPSAYLCIPFPQKRSRDQDLDHLALLWKIIISDLWKV